jgi:hypothetical protein
MTQSGYFPGSAFGTSLSADSKLGSVPPESDTKGAAIVLGIVAAVRTWLLQSNE